MLKTPDEMLRDLGSAVRTRRIGRGWSQAEAAARAGMGLRTWRRMETTGRATTENLVNAAIALRCEPDLAQLFPAPAAATLDDLLKRQAEVANPRPRQRAPRQARAKETPQGAPQKTPQKTPEKTPQKTPERDRP